MTDPTPRDPGPTADPVVPPTTSGQDVQTAPRSERSVDVREGAPDVPEPIQERRTSDDIRRDIEHTRTDLGETITEIEDRVSPRKIKQRSTARAKNRWHRIREQVMGTKEDVRDRVSSSGDGSATDSAKERAQEAREKVEGNPLAAGLIAFGGGLLASALLPATQKEQEAADRLREQVEEPVREGVQEAGQQLKDDLTEQATDRAKQVGKEAMGAAARTGTDAQDSARSVKDDAQQSAQQTRS